MAQKIIDLSNIQSQGFSIIGARPKDMSGYSVSRAGDINGDGHNDLIIGAWQSTINGKSEAGASYIIFGKNSSFSDINLVSLQASEGFYINCSVSSSSKFGVSVSGNININDDDYDDLIIGAYGTFNGEIQAVGASYIFFGKKFPTNINLDNSIMDKSQGFTIFGRNLNDFLGLSVSGAGDANGDGYGDIIVGAPYADAGSTKINSGISYLIYGRENNFQDIYVENLNTRGISFNGNFSSEYSGISVSSLDLNCDKKSDIVIGSYASGTSNSGLVYIIFGGSNLASLDLSDNLYKTGKGITIFGGKSGDKFGQSVSNAGDINGDGCDDLIIGAPEADPNSSKLNAGISYVIFGNKTLNNNIYIENLNLNQGFSLYGNEADDLSGYSVSGNVDFNNDGLDDIIVGAPMADADSSKVNSGSTYVVFGKRSGYGNLNLGSIISTEGLIIKGDNKHDNCGYSVSGAGDINNDGFDDIIIGAPGPTDLDLFAGSQTSAGKSYLIFGTATPSTAPSQAPTASPSHIPTFTPSVAPSAVPSVFPTVVPSAVPSTMPSTAPSQVPTAIPSTSSPTKTYIDIKITEGGYHEGTNAREIFIIDSTQNTEITSNGGADIFTIYIHPGVYTTITDFDKTNEVIDLSQFTGIYSKDDFDITSGSAVINLPDSQKVILQHLIPSDLDEGNFNFAPSKSPVKQPTKGTTKLSEQAKSYIYGAAAAAVPAALLLASKRICFSAFDRWTQAPITISGEYLKNLILYPCKWTYTSAYLDEIKNRKELEEHLNNLAQQKNSAAPQNQNPTSNHDVEMNANDQSIPSKTANGYQKVIPIDRDNKLPKTGHQIVNAVHTIKFDNPEIDRIYHSRLAKFDDKVTSAVEEIKEPIKLITEKSIPETREDTSSSTPSAPNPLMVPLLEVRNAIEYLPLVKYVAEAYPLVSGYLPESAKNFTIPAILDNKPFLFTAHLTIGHLGVMLLPAESVTNGLVVSTAGSTAFGMRLVASHYLSEQRQNTASKDMDSFEVAKYCAATILAYTVPSIATCAMANFIMPGAECSVADIGTKISLAGAECYSAYKASTQVVEAPTTADTVVPYVADTATAMLAYTNGYGVMNMVSSVVTADYLTRIAMDMIPPEMKEAYIDPIFDNIATVYSDGVEFMNQLIGTSAEL
jgi:hypothetical protein